jgi:hypothetical protein
VPQKKREKDMLGCDQGTLVPSGAHVTVTFHSLPKTALKGAL